MRLVRIRYKPSLIKMIVSGALGAAVHVLIDGIYHFDMLIVPDVADGTTEFGSMDGTCTGVVRTLQTVVSGAADADAARTACAGLLGERYYSVIQMQPLYPDAPGDWWMCF
jgi:hypothetical protein